MHSKVKTGDVIQIRKNGPNYIALGKVRDNEGVEYIAATKNGNISQSGAMKSPHRVDGSVRRPKIHIISGDRVKRVHGNRHVDMGSVVGSDNRLSTHLQRTTGRNGVHTDAPNIMAQIQELNAAL